MEKEFYFKQGIVIFEVKAEDKAEAYRKLQRSLVQLQDKLPLSIPVGNISGMRVDIVRQFVMDDLIEKPEDF
jgi:hypothetical protein